MSLILKKICIGILFISIKLCSQEFYVNTVSGVNVNQVFRLDVSNSSQNIENSCSPTINANEIYTDIAIDTSNNFYYVTNSGYLYKKNITTLNCEFLGNFPSQINSLTAESGNFLYAIGYLNTLYKYDINSGVYTTMGSLPTGQYAGGDLFFYESRLFLTTTSGILEINMIDPTKSCPFMSINIPNIFAAFAVSSETSSKAYIINFNTFPLFNSTLYEIDMVNKQIGSPIRSYPNIIYGAATTYYSTSTNSTCTPTSLSVRESTRNDIYFNIINPVKNTIICRTNIKSKEINSIRLFDSSGRIIKDFSNQNTIESLDVSGVTNGIYLLTVSAKNGETYTKKIIIAS